MHVYIRSILIIYLVLKPLVPAKYTRMHGEIIYLLQSQHNCCVPHYYPAYVDGTSMIITGKFGGEFGESSLIRQTKTIQISSYSS